MPQVSKDIIRFGPQDWLSGASPQYQTGLNAVSSFGDDKLTILRSMDPFRALGCLAPGIAPTAVTNNSVVSGVCLGMAIGSESGTRYGYIIAADNEVHRFDLTTTLSSGGSWPHTITGAAIETGDDIVFYNFNVASTRTPGVFYSWNDSGGAWNIGVFNNSSGAFDDDYMTTVPVTPLSASGNSKPHPMVIGVDDILYVGDGNKLHAFDGATGADGTFSSTVLTLPAQFIITAFAKTSQYLAIFAYENPANTSVTVDTVGGTNATCFLWDYLSLDPKAVIPIGDSTVSCAFEYMGTIGCITSGPEVTQEINSADRTGRLRLLNGGIFQLVATYQGTPPRKNGVTVVNDSIQWLSDGIVYCYGSPMVGVKAGLSLLTQTTGTTNGMLTFIPGIAGRLLASSGLDSSGGLERFASGYVATTFVASGVAVPNLGPAQIARVKEVAVYFAKTSTGGRAITYGIVADNGVNTAVASSVSTINATNVVSRHEYSTSGTVLPRFTELKFYCQYGEGSGSTDAPIIKYVDVKYVVEDYYPTA